MADLGLFRCQYSPEFTYVKSKAAKVTPKFTVEYPEATPDKKWITHGFRSVTRLEMVQKAYLYFRFSSPELEKRLKRPNGYSYNDGKYRLTVANRVRLID
jgi:hypothetical protein